MPYTDGVEMRNCPDCDGKGDAPKEHDCPDCQCAGDCKRCSGTGEVPVTQLWPKKKGKP